MATNANLLTMGDTVKAIETLVAGYGLPATAVRCAPVQGARKLQVEAQDDHLAHAIAFRLTRRGIPARQVPGETTVTVTTRTRA